MMTNDDFFTPKKPQNFICNICDFKCSNSKDYKRHIMTRKHKNNDEMMTNGVKLPIMNNADNFKCECGKKYTYKQGLSVHKKKCDIFKKSIINENENIIKNKNCMLDKDKLILKLIKDNEDMIKLLQEQQKQITKMIPNIGNTTINNTFNLQFFLNEQCKDALNINQFVNSLEITIDDLNYTKNNGLVKGITDVMIRGLKELDIYKRPIHCTDIKREIMYIKDENKWEKDENNEKIKEVINDIANKERESIYKWKNENPLWNKVEEVQDEFMLLVNKVYTPIEEDNKYGKKIIKNISKEVILDK